MKTSLIKNAQIINEEKTFFSDILIKDSIIQKIGHQLSEPGAEEINAEGKLLIPGIIDDQVHFREPGLTHKANIHSESKAAVAGGITSFMEMPNTVPNTLTQELLEDKYLIASKNSYANYSFFMGAGNDNLQEVLKTNPSNVCGVKIFMGSSTGNMLVDNESTLNSIFSESPMLIATHCESEKIIKENLQKYQAKYGDEIPFSCHPEIRNEKACFESSSLAVSLAKKYNTRLHILHISTEEELVLFSNEIPLKNKKITAEACVHHLFFDKSDYESLGSLIKCNPAIKEKRHRTAILNAVIDDRLDIIATDHAPHTWEEKSNKYLQAPSGLPLVQHSLQIMIELYREGKISLEKIVRKMCHAPAECFRVKDRGFIREGYKADLVLLDLNQPQKVSKENIYYKCAWSPLEGRTLNSSIYMTMVNGNIVFKEKRFFESGLGERLEFRSDN